MQFVTVYHVMWKMWKSLPNTVLPQVPSRYDKKLKFLTNEKRFQMNPNHFELFLWSKTMLQNKVFRMYYFSVQKCSCENFHFNCIRFISNFWTVAVTAKFWKFYVDRRWRSNRFESRAQNETRGVDQFQPWIVWAGWNC